MCLEVCAILIGFQKRKKKSADLTSQIPKYHAVNPQTKKKKKGR